MSHRDTQRLRGRQKQYDYFKAFNQVDHTCPNTIPVPDCSDVRQNINSENLLAGSELSLLERFAEINDKMCDSALTNEKQEEVLAKPCNQMKFSFNKNNGFAMSSPGNTSRQTTNRSSTLKDIYYKEFQKQSSRIKDLQEARKNLLSNTNKKRIVNNGNRNTQNLVSSTKGKNFTQDKVKLNNAYSKSTLNSEALTQHNKNVTPPPDRIDVQEEQEAISLKYLQQSLARRKQTQIPLTKVSYLQANSSNKQPPISKFQPTNQVEQFNARQQQFASYLSKLFDQLDLMKSGKLNRSNCQYIALRQEFKMAFGYILIRIMMKDLILNKDEFIRLGLQIIKQLDSEEFNRLLKDVNRVNSYISYKNNYYSSSTGNEGLEKTIKKNYEERQDAKNRSRYLANRQLNESPHYLKFGAKDVEDFHQFLTTVERKYQSMPMFGQTRTNEAVIKNKNPQYDYMSSINFTAQFPQIQAPQLGSYQDRNYKSRSKNPSQVKQVSRLVTFNDEQFMKEVSQPAKKKMRNISEEMILQHKRNLELIIRLKERVQSCLINSRRVVEEHSSEKYKKSYSPEPFKLNNKPEEWHF